MKRTGEQANGDGQRRAGFRAVLRREHATPQADQRGRAPQPGSQASLRASEPTTQADGHRAPRAALRRSGQEVFPAAASSGSAAVVGSEPITAQDDSDETGNRTDGGLVLPAPGPREPARQTGADGGGFVPPDRTQRGENDEPSEAFRLLDVILGSHEADNAKLPLTVVSAGGGLTIAQLGRVAVRERKVKYDANTLTTASIIKGDDGRDLLVLEEHAMQWGVSGKPGKEKRSTDTVTSCGFHCERVVIDPAQDKVHHFARNDPESGDTRSYSEQYLPKLQAGLIVPGFMFFQNFRRKPSEVEGMHEEILDVFAADTPDQQMTGDIRKIMQNHTFVSPAAQAAFSRYFGQEEVRQTDLPGKEVAESLALPEVRIPLEPAEKEGDIVQAAIPRIAMDTTMDDVLTQRSAFNPYPDQATEGVQVEFGHHNNVNNDDSYYIRYPATGREYYSLLPILHNRERFTLPQHVEPKPELPHPRDLAEIWPAICEKIVKFEIVNKVNMGSQTAFIDKAILEESSKEGIPPIRDPEDERRGPSYAFWEKVFGNLMRSSIDLMNQGKWREAVVVARMEYPEPDRVFWDKSHGNGRTLHSYIAEQATHHTEFTELIETAALVRALETEISLSDEARNKIQITYERKRQRLYEFRNRISHDPNWHDNYVSFFGNLGIDIGQLEASIGYPGSARDGKDAGGLQVPAPAPEAPARQTGSGEGGVVPPDAATTGGEFDDGRPRDVVPFVPSRDEKTEGVLSDEFAREIFERAKDYPGDTQLADLRFPAPQLNPFPKANIDAFEEKPTEYQSKGFVSIPVPPGDWIEYMVALQNEDKGQKARWVNEVLTNAMRAGFTTIQQIREATIEDLTRPQKPDVKKMSRADTQIIPTPRAEFLKIAFGTLRQDETASGGEFEDREPQTGVYKGITPQDEGWGHVYSRGFTDFEIHMENMFPELLPLDKVLDKRIELAKISGENVIVIDIGAGEGNFTRQVLKQPEVTPHSRRKLGRKGNTYLRFYSVTDAPTIQDHGKVTPFPEADESGNERITAQNVNFSITSAQQVKNLMSRLEEENADVVIASNFMQYLHPELFGKVTEDIIDVLKPGGEFRVFGYASIAGAMLSRDGDFEGVDYPVTFKIPGDKVREISGDEIRKNGQTILANDKITDDQVRTVVKGIFEIFFVNAPYTEDQKISIREGVNQRLITSPPKEMLALVLEDILPSSESMIRVTNIKKEKDDILRRLKAKYEGVATIDFRGNALEEGNMEGIIIKKH